MRIAGACVNVRVVDPLLMLKSVQEEDPEPLRALGAAFTKGITVISAVPLRGHWVRVPRQLFHFSSGSESAPSTGHVWTFRPGGPVVLPSRRSPSHP